MEPQLHGTLGNSRKSWALPCLNALTVNKFITTDAAHAYLQRSAAKMYSNSFLFIKGWKTAPSVPLIMLLWLEDHQLIFLLIRVYFRISIISKSAKPFYFWRWNYKKQTKKQEIKLKQLSGKYVHIKMKWKISHQTAPHLNVLTSCHSKCRFSHSPNSSLHQCETQIPPHVCHFSGKRRQQVIEKLFPVNTKR